MDVLQLALPAWVRLNVPLATHSPHTRQFIIPEPGEAWAR